MQRQYFSPPKKRIQTIVSLAIDQNIAELNKFFRENGSCVDECNEDENAVLLLARENKYDAVMFLITHYRANKKSAIRGAIQGKHFDLMEKLFLLNAYTIHAAAYEAARGNNEELTSYLLAKGADKNKVLYGAAAGNNKQLIDKLMQEKINVEFLIRGLIAAGNKVWVKQLLDEHPELKHIGIFEAAIAKNSQLTYELISLGADEEKAAWGAGFSHWITYIQVLDLKGKILNMTLGGAAAGGHSRLVHYLLSFHGSNIDHAIKFAAEFGHFHLTYNLLGSKPTSSALEAALFGAMKGEQIEIINSLTPFCNLNGIDKYIYCDYSANYKPDYDNTLHFIALLHEPNLREKIAKAAHARNPDLPLNKLIISAKKINHLICKGYNYPQAKALENIGANIWGFYATHIVNKKDMNDECINNDFPKLPIEIYLYICSYVFGLKDQETYELHNKLNWRLHNQVVTNYSHGLINNIYAFFSLEKEAKLAEYKNNFKELATKRLKKRLLMSAGDAEQTLPLQMRRDN